MFPDVISFSAQCPGQARDEAGEADGQSTSKSYEERAVSEECCEMMGGAYLRSFPRMLDTLLGWK